MRIFLLLFLLLFLEQCNYYRPQKKSLKKFENMSSNEKLNFLNGFISCQGDFKDESDRYADTLYHRLEKAFPIPRDIKIIRNKLSFSSESMVSISKIKDIKMGKLVSEGRLLFKDYMEVSHTYKFYIVYAYDGMSFKIDNVIVKKYK